jgi:hypothetical protein
MYDLSSRIQGQVNNQGHDSASKPAKAMAMYKMITAGLGLAASSVCLAQGSPWLQEPGTFSASVTQVHQSADELYVQDSKNDLGEDLEQDTTWLSLQYGVTDDIALDFRTGYARSTFDSEGPGPFRDQHESGRTDTNIGISFRLVDEFLSDAPLPSTVLRAGLILQGNYDTGYINSIGDGADGLELSLITGKVLNDWFAVSGEIGYRARNQDVADDIYFNVGSYFSPVSNLTVSLSYSNTNARDGLNLNSGSFNGENFHLLEEDTELVDLGVSYRLTSQFNVGANAGRVIDGKNTAESDVYALYLGYSF